MNTSPEGRPHRRRNCLPTRPVTYHDFKSEDNKAYLRLREAVLEREGYLVLTATTGTEALAILQREQVCLVLSDHMLRGTTGVALAERMKK